MSWIQGKIERQSTGRTSGRRRRQAHVRRQAGSALMMAMILIFISTAMAMTVMQSSTLGYQMTTNTIQTKAVFQAAESATEQALNDPDNISSAFQKGLNGSHTIDLDLSDFPQVTASAELRYVGSGMVAGSSAGVFEGLRFEVYGTANIDDQVRAGVTQGAMREVPTP